MDYDPFDDGGFCRSRFWLFISYIVSFGAVAGAVWVLLQDYGKLSVFDRNIHVLHEMLIQYWSAAALKKEDPPMDVWPGVVRSTSPVQHYCIART